MSPGVHYSALGSEIAHRATKSFAHREASGTGGGPAGMFSQPARPGSNDTRVALRLTLGVPGVHEVNPNREEDDHSSVPTLMQTPSVDPEPGVLRPAATRRVDQQALRLQGNPAQRNVGNRHLAVAAGEGEHPQIDVPWREPVRSEGRV